MKILLTGANGQLGHELTGSLRDIGAIIACSRQRMNLEDLGQVRDLIRSTRPDLIINTAAYTAVDQAESEPILAEQINAKAPAVMAQEAQRLGAGFVHFSTDYVFDGCQQQAYHEYDAPCPLNVYGQTKLGGEQAIANHCDAFWILRTSRVYGRHGHNFLKTIIQLAQQRTQLDVVADQWGAPTSVKTISHVLRLMLMHRAATPAPAEWLRTTCGIYHLTATGEVSWYAYAHYIVQRLVTLGIAIQLQPTAIQAVTSDTYSCAAQRPKNACLDTSKLERAFQITLPRWDTALDQYLVENITSLLSP